MASAALLLGCFVGEKAKIFPVIEPIIIRLLGHRLVALLRGGSGARW